MSDPGYTIEELAEAVGAGVLGDGRHRVRGVATITAAEADQITFLANPSYRKHLADCRAGAVIARREDVADLPLNVIISDNPYATYARIAARFQPSSSVAAGIHPSAVIDQSAQIGADVSIGPLAVIGANVRIGRGSTIGAGCVIDRGVALGEACLLHPRVTVLAAAVVGKRVILHSGVVIGADGFGLANDDGRWRKVPQLGSVKIGDDCEIGANTTIDRGALDDTVLEEDVRLDNQIQIAHNVHVGAHTAMAGCAAVAGSARIGRYCLIGGGAGILGHIEVADHVTINAMSLVTHSITDSGAYASVAPLQPQREWRRSAVRIRQLDAMARKLKKLEKDSESGR